MKHVIVTICCLLYSAILLAQGTAFITKWDLSLISNPDLNTSIKNYVYANGPVSYTWQTVPAGDSGSGVINYDTALQLNIMQIDNLPANSTIVLSIDPIHLKGLEVSNQDEAVTLIDVLQWGTVLWQDLNFNSCTSLQYISAQDMPLFDTDADLSYMFQNCYNLDSINNINKWDMHNVKHLNNMFFSANIFNQSIENWNTSNVEDMRSMFSDAYLFNQPLNNWDVSHVIYMGNMFANATAFNKPLNKWNTGNVIDMKLMFTNAGAFNQSLNNWDVSKVENMTGMFGLATSFNSALEKWDVSNVINMRNMFLGAASFNQPLEQWNVSKVVDMKEMFAGCRNFNQPLNNWDVENAREKDGMFSGCLSFNQPLNKWHNSDNPLRFNYIDMFKNAIAFNQNLGNWNMNNVPLCYGMLDNCGMDCNNYTSTIMGWIAKQGCFYPATVGAKGLKYSKDIIKQRQDLTKMYNINMIGDTINADACCYTTYNKNINTLACEGYIFNNQPISKSGFYYDTLINANGCDSLVTLKIEIKNPPTADIKIFNDTLKTTSIGNTYQWMDCSLGRKIYKANSAAFKPTTSGYYAVLVDVVGCADLSDCIYVDVPFPKITLYPNPANTCTKIESTNTMQNATICITNINGQVVQQINNVNGLSCDINMNLLLDGMYCATIVTSNYVEKIKFRKQK